MALALDASYALGGSQQQAWLARLDTEEPNIHAALAWTLEHGTAESALKYSSALWRYWLARGRLIEGKQWQPANMKAAVLVEDTDFGRGWGEAAIRQSVLGVEVDG